MKIRDYLHQAMQASHTEKVDCALVCLKSGKTLKIYTENDSRLDQDACVASIYLGTAFSIDQYVNGSAFRFRIDSPI